MDLAQLSTMNQIFDILSKKDGIIGIHARPGLGKTTLARIMAAEAEAEAILKVQQATADALKLLRQLTLIAPHETERALKILLFGAFVQFVCQFFRDGHISPPCMKFWHRQIKILILKEQRNTIM